MRAEWNLRYDCWIIEDGEPHLAVNEVFEWFAIEFSADAGLVRAQESFKSAASIADYKYQVVAELVDVSEKWCIIDFGLKAISPLGWVMRDLLPTPYQVGDYFTGEIALGLPLCTEVVPDDARRILRQKFQ